MNSIITYLVMSIGFAILTWLDDLMSGIVQKFGRYIRILLLSFGALFFFDPINSNGLALPSMFKSVVPPVVSSSIPKPF